MNSKLKGILVLIIFFGFLALGDAEETKKQDGFDVSVTRILAAFEKAVLFYQRDRYDLNLDAYFGLRIAQGNLHEITHKKRTAQALLKYGILDQVRHLQELVSEIAATSSQVLAHSSPAYFNLVGSAVSQPWRAVKPYRKINQNLATPFSKRRLSDDILRIYEPCLAQLLGSPGSGERACDISEQCWRVMVRPGEIGYVLTHQALYFLFGEQRGCLQKFSQKTKEDNSSLDSVYDRICSNIYPQLLLVERVKPITRGDADLLMEQSVVCGLLGYYEFLTPRRLRNVLQWQRPSGCFGKLDDRDADSEQDNRRTMRRLLMSKELEDGCESHITGVGTALLSIYLRYILNDAPMTD